ncbi:MAG TPA: DUF29 domain-containing protein, partial [Candidatus Binataceae bacterium]|nr:DUF29 domain-containing protein [Candidatus Binataceae bacterium]
NKRGRSWQLTIREQRQRVARVISQNPGLKSVLNESLSAAYALACVTSARETGLDEAIFPPASPWSFEQITDPNFWPTA